MKVLHVTRTYYPDTAGGIEQVIRQICLATKCLGVQSRIFALSVSPDPKEVELLEGVVIRERSIIAPASCDISGYASFVSFLNAAEWADVVHFHFPWPFFDVLNMMLPRAKRRLLTYHSDVVRQRLLNVVYKPLQMRTLNAMDAIVATSLNYARTSRVLTDPNFKDKLKIIPLGLADEVENNGCNGLKSDVAVRFGLVGRKFVLALGVLRYYKGFQFLIEASEGIDDLVVIAGCGPERRRLEQMVRQRGLKNVLFIGFVTDEEKFDLYKLSHLFVLPSHLRSEAFGMVLLEASMFSKPLVTCEIGTGTSFVNLNNVTGFVVEPGSPTALAKAINLILRDSSLSHRFSVASRRRYESLFSGHALGLEYSTLYRELLDGVGNSLLGH